MAKSILIATTVACLALAASAQRWNGGNQGWSQSWVWDGQRWVQQSQQQQQQQPKPQSQQWLDTRWQNSQPWQNNQGGNNQGGNNQGGKWSFQTSMDGYQNGVNTAATGKCWGTVDEYAQTVTGFVNIRNIKQVTGVHFHLGPRGQTGDKVAWLWPVDTKAFTTQPFDTDNWTVAFTITAGDIIAAAKPFAVNNFQDFAKALREGNIYVNVHTKPTKDGEIRGQISRS